MMLRNCFKFFCILSCLLFNYSSYAQNGIGQTIQIYTHLKSILGKPEWLIELRDMNSGRVLPYVYEIRNNDNFWIAFSTEHSYRVVASTLKFGIYASIPNFCHIEDGVLSGKSMFITLYGHITPDPRTSKCFVRVFKNMPFNVSQ